MSGKEEATTVTEERTAGQVIGQSLDQSLSIEQRAQIFAALADPNRLRIVALLTEQEEASGSHLAKEMGISLALFCHHSKTLIAAGLIQVRKQGQVKFLSLNQALLNQCCTSFGVPN